MMASAAARLAAKQGPHAIAHSRPFGVAIGQGRGVRAKVAEPLLRGRGRRRLEEIDKVLCGGRTAFRLVVTRLQTWRVSSKRRWSWGCQYRLLFGDLARQQVVLADQCWRRAAIGRGRRSCSPSFGSHGRLQRSARAGPRNCSIGRGCAARGHPFVRAGSVVRECFASCRCLGTVRG